MYVAMLYVAILIAEPLPLPPHCVSNVKAT